MLDFRPGIHVVVLSEFCALVCRVPFDATVEHVKAGLVCCTSALQV